LHSDPHTKFYEGYQKYLIPNFIQIKEKYCRAALLEANKHTVMEKLQTQQQMNIHVNVSCLQKGPYQQFKKKISIKSEPILHFSLVIWWNQVQV